MAKNSSKSQNIYWHAPLAHETGCVVFIGSPLPECRNEIATDVTRMAASMAFCRGVSDAQPVVKASKQTSKVFIDSSVIRGKEIIAQVPCGN